MEKLNNYAESQEFIKSLSAKTGVPAGYILIGLVIIVIALLYNGVGGLAIILLLGFMYPAYVTFKAVKYNNQELMFKFAKFWTVMAFGIVLHELLEWFMPDFPLFNIITIVALLFMVKSRVRVY